MEVSEEDHIEFDIQNDAVYECEVRFVVKKSQTTDKNFHYFFVNDQQFNRIAIHKSGTYYFWCVEKDCRAQINCKYSCKEASTSDEEPTVYK